MNIQLNTLRNQLDEIDAELVNLLGKRFSVTRKVGVIKAQLQLPTIDKNREKLQMQRITRLSQNRHINPALSRHILRTIITEVVDEHQQAKKAETPPSNVPTIGIIGLGDFGSFLATVLAPHANLRCFDADASTLSTSPHKSSLQEVLQSQFVILAVPFNALKPTLLAIRSHLKPGCTLVDVCSVKIQSQELFDKILPQHRNVVFTHPLFGPQSAGNGLVGHTIVFTNPKTPATKEIMQFCRSTLGLCIVTMSASKHDKAMAEIHALTFFLARGLRMSGVAKNPFQTPSFQILLDLVALDASQSQELFLTVELANPFAGEARLAILTHLTNLHNQLSKQ